MEEQYFDELMESLEQAAAYVKGDTSKCRIHVVEVPDPVPKYGADDIIRTRRELNLTQNKFAYALGVSPGTVQSWEAGRNEISGAARHLLYLFDTDHSLVDRIMARYAQNHTRERQKTT